MPLIRELVTVPVRRHGVEAIFARIMPDCALPYEAVILSGRRMHLASGDGPRRIPMSAAVIVRIGVTVLVRVHGLERDPLPPAAGRQATGRQVRRA